MTHINIDALTTPELRGELCNIVERSYHGMPRPGTDSDDGIRYTSDQAWVATDDILDAVYRVFGVERPKVDQVEVLRVTFPGQADEWYAAKLARLEACQRGEEMPEFPDEDEDEEHLICLDCQAEQERERKSIYRGVSFDPEHGKWLMSLHVEGLYDTEEGAALAHDAVQRHYLNGVDGEGKVCIPTQD